VLLSPNRGCENTFCCLTPGLVTVLPLLNSQTVLEQVGVQIENVFFLFFSVQIEQRKASKAPKNRFSKKVEREHNFQVFGQLPFAADFNAIR